jgi:putative tryptophan/tyrosine transport system substrate-binding protein
MRLAQSEALRKAMRRRDFIKVAACSAITWPLAGRAQQPAMPVIGFLNSASPKSLFYESRVDAFRQGLAEAGYVEGQNAVIEYRWAENQIDRLQELAGDLVRRNVSVIVAGGSPASALAAKSATTTIPVVFMNAADPVSIGLVANLSRPGGNITGVTTISTELGAKRLGLLRELVPSVASIAMLVNPSRPGVDAQMAQAQESAQALGLPIHIVKADGERDFDAAFRTVVQLRAGALVVAPDALFSGRCEQIVALEKSYSLPAMHELRDFVAAGGLMSYGATGRDEYRQSATLVGRILKGEKPADLPIMQPTKFELVINLKTAKALGLNVPISMQLLADELIE